MAYLQLIKRVHFYIFVTMAYLQLIKRVHFYIRMLSK